MNRYLVLFALCVSVLAAVGCSSSTQDAQRLQGSWKRIDATCGAQCLLGVTFKDGSHVVKTVHSPFRSDPQTVPGTYVVEGNGRVFITNDVGGERLEFSYGFEGSKLRFDEYYEGSPENDRHTLYAPAGA